MLQYTRSTTVFFLNSVKYRYKGLSKLRPPSLFRPLALVPKCNVQCIWVLLRSPVVY